MNLVLIKNLLKVIVLSTKFYQDRRFLIENKYIFQKPNKKKCIYIKCRFV